MPTAREKIDKLFEEAESLAAENATERRYRDAYALGVLRSALVGIVHGDDWWRDYQEVASFSRHLVEQCGYDAEELLAVIESPRRWTDEYNRWKATGDAVAPETEGEI